MLQTRYVAITQYSSVIPFHEKFDADANSESLATSKFFNCELVLAIKTLICVGWGATALDGFPGLKQVAFEERNPTINAIALFS